MKIKSKSGKIVLTVGECSEAIGISDALDLRKQLNKTITTERERGSKSKIKIALEKSGFTKKEAAERIAQITGGTVATELKMLTMYIQRGINVKRLDKLQAYAKALTCDIYDL